MDNNRANSKDFEEIDLIAIIVRLWSKRPFIARVTAAFMVLGLLVGIFTSTKFTANCVMVPQTSDISMSGNLSSLAQLAGVSLNSGGNEVISPLVYENILKNVNLQKELISTPFYFEEYSRDITLLDYYTADEYKKFSPMDIPKMIMNAIRGEDEENPYLAENRDPQLQYYTKDEVNCIKAMDETIALSVEDDGYVTISAIMPEAILAAQVVNRVQMLLQKYITEFKIDKAKSEYEFINKLYETAKVDFEDIQLKYAKFKDANKILSSASSQIRETTLKSEYDIANSTLIELTSQLIQAEIKLKEDTPTFIIIEPTKVPMERSTPKRALILVIFTILGGIVACGLVIFFDFLKGTKEFDIKHLEKW